MLGLNQTLAQSPTVQERFGAALLTPDNTIGLDNTVRRGARIVFETREAPVLGPDQNTPGHQLLRQLVASGLAAGNRGDLYENRDRGHSRLPFGAHPQMTYVVYDGALEGQGVDYGLAQVMLFDAPLIGNSSTAVTGPIWRSQPRLALTSPGGARTLYQNYVSGQIHVYPEHRDHDPERGDLLPANTPYVLISQGSSGSDQAHLEALVMIMAAFRPDTKARLLETGLIAPTVQMVYRRARNGIGTRDAYLSGAAHPSVFSADGINLAAMVGLANAITPDAVPPLVRLEVLEETTPLPGVDYFGDGLSEMLFDTPSAIARIWRSKEGTRRMVVTAADTVDPNGRDLTFDWVLLRGDPEQVRITPLTADARYALIEIGWQDPRPAPGTPDILSARIDLGVFANNGAYDSAPGFISVLLPRHETRLYELAPEGGKHPVEITRAAAEEIYFDPMIFPVLPWSDQ
ncbi:MAG: hypothetical protein HRU31_19250, partial [Rhodobacteraceae bacterium]|nr:hypothetical protein [Paracoccaceae bacterium]